MDIKEFKSDIRVSLGAAVSFTLALASTTWLIASVYFEFKLHTQEIEWTKERIEYVNDRHDRISHRVEDRIVELESIINPEN